jgi:hypothetical protein
MKTHLFTEIFLKLKLLAFLLVLLLGAGGAGAQILNGDFETPVVGTVSVLGLGLIPGVGVYTSLTNPTGITDWTVGSGDVTLVDAGGTLTSALGLFPPHTGNEFVVLNGLQESITLIPLTIGLSQIGSVGTLSQTFTTTPGQTYQIGFSYRGLAVGVLTNNPILDANVTNTSNSSMLSTSLLTATISLNAWQSDSFDFVATGTSSTLSFYQSNGGLANIGLVGLDSVVISLPESRDYMAAAFGLMGLLIAGRVMGQGWAARKVTA